MSCSRVLVAYHFGPKAIPLGEQVSRAFERNGMAVLRFDSGIVKSFWDKPRRIVKSLAKLVGQKPRLARYWERQGELATAERFRVAALAFRPELILIIRGDKIEARVVAEVKQTLQARVVLWWVKTTRWQGLMERDGKVFDATFTIHQRLAQDGVRHMPAFALDGERYFQPAVREERWPLLFVGCWSERRQRFLESLADQPLTIIGPNWRKRLPINHPLRHRLGEEWVSDAALADCYRAAGIVIDIGQIERRQDEGETMRVADVPACGAVLMTEPSLAVSRYFRPGSVVVFETPEQLRVEVIELLTRPEKKMQIATQAATDAAELPTFDRRIGEILEASQLNGGGLDA